jgi:GNAT superfamily N-acetyltransferase
VADVDIRPVAFDAPDAQSMVTAALADLAGRYGGSGDDTPVTPDEFRPPAGEFLVAYIDGEPVGCAGWRARDDLGSGVAELKRMFTTDRLRGAGVGRRVLAAVEASARSYGRHRLVLECGSRQPEAIAFYAACGYERIPDFGYYREYPGVRSFGRTLSP